MFITLTGYLADGETVGETPVSANIDKIKYVRGDGSDGTVIYMGGDDWFRVKEAHDEIMKRILELRLGQAIAGGPVEREAPESFERIYQEACTKFERY